MGQNAKITAFCVDAHSMLTSAERNFNKVADALAHIVVTTMEPSSEYRLALQAHENVDIWENGLFTYGLRTVGFLSLGMQLKKLS